MESRRGSGGFVRIAKMRNKKTEHSPVVVSEQMPVISIRLQDLDRVLFRLLKQKRITNRDAVLLHHTFTALFAEVDDEQQRLAVVSRILEHI